MCDVSMSSLAISSSSTKDGILVNSPPISRSLKTRPLDGHKGSVGLTLYPLHKTLWFKLLFNVIMDGSL